MQIEIQSPQFPMTTALNEYLKGQLKGQLSSLSERIRSVHAHMSDVNGQRGGADKRCRLVVHLSKTPTVVVESTETDLYQAIHRATNRLRRAVERRGRKRVVARRRQQLPMNLAEELSASSTASSSPDYGDTL